MSRIIKEAKRDIAVLKKHVQSANVIEATNTVIESISDFIFPTNSQRSYDLRIETLLEEFGAILNEKNKEIEKRDKVIKELRGVIAVENINLKEKPLIMYANNEDTLDKRYKQSDNGQDNPHRNNNEFNEPTIHHSLALAQIPIVENLTPGDKSTNIEYPFPPLELDIEAETHGEIGGLPLVNISENNSLKTTHDTKLIGEDLYAERQSITARVNRPETRKQGKLRKIKRTKKTRFSEPGNSHTMNDRKFHHGRFQSVGYNNRGSHLQPKMRDNVPTSKSQYHF